MWALASLAVAGDPWRVGVAAALTRDLPDASLASEGARFGFGGGIVVPVRYELAPGASLRATLEATGAQGTDRVEWTARSSGERVLYYSDAHWAMYGATTLALGPELSLRGRVAPYLGASAGGALVATWHSFWGDSAVLLDPDQNDLDDPGNVDPWTLQGVPAAGAHVGVRIGAEDRVALEVEAGYTMAFLPAAPLRKSTPALDASRSAYALDVMRLGLGISLP
ncbi:MAG: hypothetical protein ACOZNI_37560 [Myxococcota bacterium]